MGMGGLVHEEEAKLPLEHIKPAAHLTSLKL